MSVWAYECRQCVEPERVCFVSCSTVDSMPAGARRLRVKVGREWVCALVDRTRRLDVEGMLLRMAVAAEEGDCDECEELDEASTRRVQAAAISLPGAKIVVVLVGLELVHSAGEAEMFIADLRSHFAGASIVLMGQREDGTPVYYGDQASIELIADLPVDEMEWSAHPIG